MRLPSRAASVALAIASVLGAQDPAADRAALADAAREGGDVAASLARLHRRGELSPEGLAAALEHADETVRTTAARIVRHAVLEIPTAVHDALARSLPARIALLTELAEAPRPAFAAFVEREAASPDPSARLLALAARSEGPSREEAAFVLEHLAADAERTAAQAAARMSSTVADGLVSRLHAHLEKGLPVERVRPFLERLSPLGVRQLLGLTEALPEEKAVPLVDFLAQRDDAEFLARVTAMLDGKLPMQAAWVRRSCAGLADPVRRSRVAALCAKACSPSASEGDTALGVAAFEALLDAGVYEPALAAFARVGRSDRWRRLAQQPLQGMPTDLLERELVFEDALELDAASMLRVLASARRPLSAALERRVASFAREATERPGGRESGSFREALHVLAGVGGDSAAKAAVELAGRDLPSLYAVAEHFAHRKDPVGAEALRILLHELPTTAGDAYGDLRRTILVLLAETGNPIDPREITAVAATLRPSFLHRCRASVPRLAEADAQLVLAQLPAAEPEVRAELLGWLARSPGTAVLGALRAGLASEHEEVRTAAYEGLLVTDEREAMLEQGMAAAGADAAQDELFAYAALATASPGWPDADVRFVQWLLFTAPRRDPSERARAAHFQGARSGFPMVVAIAAHLRRSPETALMVVEPARALAAKRDVEGLARQRFLFLWTGLQANPWLVDKVARATAELVLAIPDENDAGLGVASYYAAQDAEDRADFAVAAAHADTAVAAFLLDPAAVVDQRIHLGVREIEDGIDAHARLAAAPHRLRARDAIARKDLATARQALANARELAGRDAATLHDLKTLEPELR